MDIRELRYFLAVCREGSISAAAEKLAMTQPPLSKQIKSLEDELGVILFNRGNKTQKLQLTKEGYLLQKRAETIIDQLNATKQDIATMQNTVTGDVYIGAGESYGMHIIGKVWQELLNVYPHLRIHIYSGNAEEVKEKLSAQQIDFAITFGTPTIQGYHYLPLPYEDVLGLLINTKIDLFEKHYITAQELLNIPLFLSRQMLSDNELTGWLGYSPQRLNIRGTYNLITTAAQFVRLGLGAAITLKNLVPEDEQLNFIPFAPNFTIPMKLCYAPTRELSSAAQIFLQAIKQTSAFTELQ